MVRDAALVELELLLLALKVVWRPTGVGPYAAMTGEAAKLAVKGVLPIAQFLNAGCLNSTASPGIEGGGGTVWV